jgi:hypothetical protein
MRLRPVVFALTLFCAVPIASCSPPPPAASTSTPPADATDPGPVMGAARINAAELASWFESRGVVGARPTVSIAELARLFIDEGNREGVAGDVAFVQSVLETGWFTFPDRGQVRPWFNNFAGIGAVDGGSVAGPAQFADARTGVRAQIQHLRAYADPTVTCSNFATTTVTPRCHLVVPKGKAPTWSQFGGGVWATDPTYASKIERLYGQLVAHARG